MPAPVSRKSEAKQRALPLCIAGAAAALLLCTGKGRRYPVQGRITLITGSSRGLGLALAEQFARAGARVVLTARSDGDLERARALLLERRAVRPDSILIKPCDLRSSTEVEQLFRFVERAWGRVEVLVNNAGIISVGPAESQTLANFEDAMRTNYFGTLHCVLAAVPQMLARGEGVIVNITSIGGKIAVPHLLPYSASKFACVGLSQGLAAELRSKGIRVSTVTPGLMRTGSPRNALFTGKRAEEYRWFNLGASLPGVSRDAWAAAGRILRGTETGESEFSITPQAALAARLAPLVPGITSALLSLVNRFLPASQANASDPLPGRNVDGKDLTELTAAGRTAAAQWNES